LYISSIIHLSKINDMKKTLSVLVLLFISYSSFAQIPGYISPDSLLCWYPFTGNAHNAYGIMKDGTVTGAVLDTDRFGNANCAYRFNGKTDNIIIDTAFFNVSWSDYTISFWANSDSSINPYSSGNVQTAINTIPHYGFDIAYNYNAYLNYVLFYNSNPGIVAWDMFAGTPTPAATTARVWNHIAVARMHDTAYKFYLNGVLDTTFISHTLPVSYMVKIILGNNDPSVSTNGFLGKLDDYGIWKRTLSGCEIRRMFDTVPFTYLTGQPANATVAPGGTAHFKVVDTGVGNTYQWQENTGSGFANLSNTPPYSGVTTATLTVTPVTLTMNNYKYRCIVSGAYPCTDSSASGKLILNTLSTTVNNTPKNITISPNPTTGDVTVTGAGKTDIRIFNSIGQLVKEARNTDKLSIAELPAGVYMIKLNNDQGLVYYDKIIRN
jgi:concanavalin A-like lectin/glucanase superfamily protein/type IX secretion system substrate protein